MNITYNNLDIHFSLDGYSIHVFNISTNRFTGSVPLHSHGTGCYEIHYISSGCGRLQCANQEYSITPNTLFVTGPHIDHAQIPTFSDPMHEYCIYLRLRKSASSDSRSAIINSFANTPFWFGQETQNIQHLLTQLFDELGHQYSGYRNQVELLLAQLLICLVRNYEKGKEASHHPAAHNPADNKSLLIENYFLSEYQILSLEALARRLNLSTRQTQRILKEYYGKTFQQKKSEARMSAACILLQDHNRSIASISEALGYSSAEHFTSSFRKYYGISPREYRKK